MKSLLSFLLLVVVASTVFASGIPTFAQETTQNQTMNDGLDVDESADAGTSDDNATDEETTTDDTGEETSDETATDDTSNETEEYATTSVDSPLAQLMTGTDPHAIQCDTGFKLAFKATNFQPACLKESTYQILSQRGWVSNHDPTQEELSAMISALPKPAEETNDAMDDTTNDSAMDDTTDDSENTGENSTSGDEPTPQSHEINLSESMDMGAN